VVVYQQYRRRLMPECLLDDNPGMHLGAVETAGKQFFVADQAVTRIQEQTAENFPLPVAQFRPQPVPHLLGVIQRLSGLQRLAPIARAKLEARSQSAGRSDANPVMPAEFADGALLQGPECIRTGDCIRKSQCSTLRRADQLQQFLLTEGGNAMGQCFVLQGNP